MGTLYTKLDNAMLRVKNQPFNVVRDTLLMVAFDHVSESAAESVGKDIILSNYVINAVLRKHKVGVHDIMFAYLETDDRFHNCLRNYFRLKKAL